MENILIENIICNSCKAVYQNKDGAVSPNMENEKMIDGEKVSTAGRESVRSDDSGERVVNGHVFRGSYSSTNPCIVCGAWEDEAMDINCHGREDE